MRNFKLSLKSLAVITSMIGLSFGAQSCVDNQYDLDNISSEVTIGGGDLIIPLTTIDPISLSEMVGKNIQNLEEENGAYVLKFAGEGKNFSIDNISLPTLSNIAPKVEDVSFSLPTLPTEFMFSEIKSSFTMGYPDISVSPNFGTIKFGSPINLGLSYDGGATVPSFGEYKIEVEESKGEFPISFTIPDEIKSVGKILFGDKNNSKGSLINIALEFKGLKSINGGGELNMTIIFPENYMLTDSNGNPIGNVLKLDEYTVKGGVEAVEIKAYLQSIDLKDKKIINKAMNIMDEITYSFDYTFNTVSGYINTSNLPQFNVSIAPTLRDMEVTLNRLTIDNENHSSEITYTLNGIPESISKIDYIAFESAPITMRVAGLSWLKTDALTAEINMPKCFVFEEDKNGWLNTSTNKMTAPIRQLEKGITLNLMAINLATSNAQLQSGQLNISTSISSHISDLEEGLSLLLSDITPPTQQVSVSTIIDEAHFSLDLANSKVAMKEQHFDFQLNENQLPSLEHTIAIHDELASIERLELQSPNGGKVKIRLSISHPDGDIFPVDKVNLSLSVNFKKMIILPIFSK